MPLTLFQRLKAKGKPTYTAAAAAAFVLGLIAHGYRMTNWLPNWDSLVFREDPQHMASLGRWFLPVASFFSSDYELPWLNGLLALVYLSTAAVFVCETLCLRSRLAAALTGGLIAVFPAITSVFTYCYVADAYCLAFLLACVAAWALSRGTVRSFLAAVPLLALSAGIYQAYLTVTVALLLVFLVRELLFGNDTPGRSLRRAGWFLLGGILALALYGAVQAAVTALFSVKLLDYQGLSGAFSFSAFRPLTSAGAALYVFFHHFADFSNGFNLYSVLNLAVAAALAVGYFSALRHSKASPGTAVLSLLYLAALPFGCCALFFVNSDLDYHNLMRMSFVAVYLFLPLFYDRLPRPAGRLDTGKAWVAVLLSGALIAHGTVLANISYHKLQIAFEKSYGLVIRLADRIESTDGAAQADRLLLVGQLKDSETYAVTFPPTVTGTTDGLLLRRDDETVGQSVVTAALRDYGHVSLSFLHGEEAHTLKASPAVAAMPCWPADGSVAVSNGVIIVKFSDEAETEAAEKAALSATRPFDDSAALPDAAF